MRAAVVPLKGSAEAWGAKLAGGEWRLARCRVRETFRFVPNTYLTKPLWGQARLRVRTAGRCWTTATSVRDTGGAKRVVARHGDRCSSMPLRIPSEVLPVQLTEVKPRTYRGTVIPTKPGSVRISVRATGKMASGTPFTTETLLTNSSMTVKPVAARFLGITAKAIAPAEGAKFDRLEVSASLDVLIPGEYLLALQRERCGRRSSARGGHRRQAPRCKRADSP